MMTACYDDEQAGIGNETDKEEEEMTTVTRTGAARDDGTDGRRAIRRTVAKGGGIRKGFLGGQGDALLMTGGTGAGDM